jgi:hypothetical protein
MPLAVGQSKNTACMEVNLLELLLDGSAPALLRRRTNTMREANH